MCEQGEARHDEAEPPPPAEPDGTVLEFGVGFDDDGATVILDGRQVWQGRGLTTNYSVGLAGVVPLPQVAAGGVLEVRVGGRRQVFSVPADGATRLRCDIVPGGDLTLGAAPEGPYF